MSRMIRVLLIEDSEIDAKLIEHTLLQHGFESVITRVETPDELRRALAESQFDTILVDYLLPNFSGIQALRIVKQAGVETPIIAVSNVSGEEEAVAMMRAGAQDYIMKDRLTRLAPVVEREMKISTAVRRRKEAEERLRLNELNFETILNSVTDGIITIDAEDRILIFNTAAEFMFRCSAHEVIGTQIGRFIPESVRENHSDYVRQFGASGSSRRSMLHTSLELTCQRADGENFPGEISISKIAIGQKLFYTAIVRDATERKKSELLLRESEERYRKLFEEDLTGDFITSYDGRLVDCNPAFLKIFGFEDREEALKTNVLRLYPNPDTRAELLRRLQKERALENYEIELRRSDGAPVHVLINIVGVFDDDERLIETRGYVFDISKQKELERQIQESQKLESIGTLASGLAHDFNNILGIIMGNLDSLSREPSDTKRIDRSLEVMRTAVNRGASLVRQILTFARKTDLRREPLNVNEVIREIEILIGETFPKTIETKLELSEPIPIVMADRTQLHQALLNIVVNARDAMPKGGVLRIATTGTHGSEVDENPANGSTSAYVRITIQDSGTGMEKEMMRRIFEPFFTTKEKGKGTGLGLSVVHGIVHDHNGHIEVDSALGSGTAFRIFLKAVENHFELQEATIGTEEEDLRGNETLLLVEDEAYLSEVVCQSLTDNGYTVLMARTAHEAIALFSQRHGDIALVLSDIGLPGMSGDEMYLKMKQTNPDIKTVLMTGYLEPEKYSQLIQSGIREVLMKPIRQGELLKVLRGMLTH